MPASPAPLTSHIAWKKKDPPLRCRFTLAQPDGVSSCVFLFFFFSLPLFFFFFFFNFILAAYELSVRDGARHRTREPDLKQRVGGPWREAFKSAVTANRRGALSV